MKLDNNSSSAKTLNPRLVISRVSWESLRMPKYALITTTMLAFALLAGANIFRERDARHNAQVVQEQAQLQLANVQSKNVLIRQDTNALRQNKDVIARTAQNKLGYVRPNEIVVVVK